MRGPLFAMSLLVLASLVGAQEPSSPADTKTEEIHDELREMRDDILDAIQRSDFDAIEPYLHPNVVFTPMNAEVSRGPEEIRAYFEKMLEGPEARVESVRLDLTVDRLTDLYGDVGLAYGSSNDHYTLRNGMEFSIDTRWTCAMVRQGGTWLITGFHASADVFDNPILQTAKLQTRLWWGGLALVLGLVLGGLLIRSFGAKNGG